MQRKFEEIFTKFFDSPENFIQLLKEFHLTFRRTSLDLKKNSLQFRREFDTVFRRI